MEIKAFEDKLNELTRLAYEVKGMAADYQMAVMNMERQASEAEVRLDNAQKAYAKLNTEISTYRTEFEAKKKEELAKLEQQKKETKAQQDESEKIYSDATRKLADVIQKEKALDTKLQEVSQLKVDLEKKREEFRSFIQKM